MERRVCIKVETDTIDSGEGSGNVAQPIQWSSEFTDTDLGLVYYNYRHTTR